jgi:hypothetical protein
MAQSRNKFQPVMLHKSLPCITASWRLYACRDVEPNGSIADGHGFDR